MLYVILRTYNCTMNTYKLAYGEPSVCLNSAVVIVAAVVPDQCVFPSLRFAHNTHLENSHAISIDGRASDIFFWGDPWRGVCVYSMRAYRNWNTSMESQSK